MTFADEEVQSAFHKLPTQVQYEWACFEVSLAERGEALHITAVSVSPEGREDVSCTVILLARTGDP